MRIAEANLEIESDDCSCLPDEICFETAGMFNDKELIGRLAKGYFSLDSDKVDEIFEGDNGFVMNLFLCYEVKKNFVGGWGDFHECMTDSDLDGFDLAKSFDNKEDQEYLYSLLNEYCSVKYHKSLNEYIKEKGEGL